MNEELAKIIKEDRVASLTTTSLNEILKLFPMQGTPFSCCITSIKAHASSSEKSRPLIDDQEYGIAGYIDKSSDSFNLDYNILFNEENGVPENPLDAGGINRVLTSMRKLGFEDAAVDNFTVIVRDKEIGRLAGIDEELFHLTMVSEPVDGDMDRAKVKEHEVNERLFKYHGFKHRIMHCKKLIDRRQELTKKQSEQKPLIHWRGSTITSLRSPIKIAQKVKEHFGEYGLIKKYGQGSEDTLVLLDVSR